MTLARDPLTFQHATTRVAAVLTVKRMAAITRRSTRLVHKWTHPEARAYPTLEKAVALDAAFMAAGGDGAPFLETYARLLDIEVERQIACHLALASDIAVAARETGEAIAYALAVTQPGSGQREVHRAIGETEEACSAMAVVLRRLSSFLPVGAVPAGETVGGAQ